MSANHSEAWAVYHASQAALNIARSTTEFRRAAANHERARRTVAETVRGIEPEAIAMRLLAMADMNRHHVAGIDPEGHAALHSIAHDLADATPEPMASALREFAASLDPADDHLNEGAGL